MGARAYVCGNKGRGGLGMGIGREGVVSVDDILLSKISWFITETYFWDIKIKL